MLMGVPPTGKQVTVTAIDIARLADDKIVEHWGQMDTLGLLQQLGAIPTPG
jgi:predicted ester cyclase